MGRFRIWTRFGRRLDARAGMRWRGRGLARFGSAEEKTLRLRAAIGERFLHYASRRIRRSEREEKGSACSGRNDRLGEVLAQSSTNHKEKGRLLRSRPLLFLRVAEETPMAPRPSWSKMQWSGGASPAPTNAYVSNSDEMLEDELQAELDVAGAAAADDGVGGFDVGRGACEAEVAAREIFADRTEREDRVVENVEDFAAELQLEAFAEIPGFAERAVPIGKAGAAEDVAAHIAERADGVGIEDGAVLHVATAFLTQTVLERRRVGGREA